MNCRQTRDLISAYLDQELTGQQMLEIHAHLTVCHDCTRECHETREVRRLLRSLIPLSPPVAVQQRLTARLDREELSDSGLLVLATALLCRLPTLRWDLAAADSRPRGRRLASALALSSMAILAVAAPLVAPPASDQGGRGVPPAAMQAGMGGLPLMTPSSGWDGGSFSPLHLLATPAVPPAPALAQPYAQTAAQNMNVEPLRDEAVSEYAQGSATFAGFQSSTAGRW